MFHHDGRCPLQKRFLTSISKASNPRRTRLCHKRSTRRGMQKPLGDMLTHTQVDTGWILLAYYAERCPILCEGVRQVPTLQQRHTTTNRGTHANERSLAIRLVGIGHSRPFSHGHAAIQVPYCGDRLLYQMGRGRTISHHHRKECPELCLERHHLQLRNPQGPRI